MDRSTIGLALVSMVALILPIMALAGRKVPASRLAGMALMWVVVFGVAWLVVQALGY
jgi:hypothetical protein